MITKELTHPSSIVVVGGSDNIHNPGGSIIRNLIEGNFAGDLYVLNPKADKVQGIVSYRRPEQLPDVDLAIIAIAASYTPDIIKFLSQNKHTKAFIILSAGFSEAGPDGKKLENRVVDIINRVGGSLIGPNCTGILTPQHHSIFTKPIPKLNPKGCDFISGSGATACFIMESGIAKGLQFANVYSVGNSAQIGVEEVLRHMDENFNMNTDSLVKLLYLENIDKPQMFLKYSSSLIRKGCRIAAVKAGASEAGSRAASSHTGALASSDVAVDALFRKAGIVRCYGREDLISVASVFMYPKLSGKNIAVITHAGGPAVMLTDALSVGGLVVPHISGKDAESLKEKLFPGSSVSNPIDFLATGTTEQLGIIIDYVNEKFNNIDAMVVIFGTPGLVEIFDVYELLEKKISTSKKPIYPVMPSVLTTKNEIGAFVAGGGVYFPDEVTLGNALVRINNTPKPSSISPIEIKIDHIKIRNIIDNSDDGYLPPDLVQKLLDAAGIKRANELIVSSDDVVESAAEKIGFPLVMKVVGPVHKSDIGGVSLNIKDISTVFSEMRRMLEIDGAKGVLLQPMLSGIELFAGVKKEDKFGHLIMFGLGGIFIEVTKDVRAVLTPVSETEVLEEIKKLKGYSIIKGTRGMDPIDEEKFVDIIVRLSSLVKVAPEIIEMDINPLLGNKNEVVAVDARIHISRS